MLLPNLVPVLKSYIYSVVLNETLWNRQFFGLPGSPGHDHRRKSIDLALSFSRKRQVNRSTCTHTHDIVFVEGNMLFPEMRPQLSSLSLSQPSTAKSHKTRTVRMFV